VIGFGSTVGISLVARDSDSIPMVALVITPSEIL
jgi:hypothetical protein